jgi:hypothetical protein
MAMVSKVHWQTVYNRFVLLWTLICARLCVWVGLFVFGCAWVGLGVCMCVFVFESVNVLSSPKKDLFLLA